MNIECISLKNIKLQQNGLLKEIFYLVSNHNYDSTKIKQLHHTLITKAAIIEKICAERQATPANLTQQSRKIYSWIKFLTDEYYLQLHLKNTFYMLQGKRTLFPNKN
jgi:hypothetical protein